MRKIGAGGALLALRAHRTFPLQVKAGGGIRTLDINLGKVALYQLSYSSRVNAHRRNTY